MAGLSFIPDASVASYLDSEYFINRSGNKQASPLVERWSGQPDQSSGQLETRLASVIVNRYKPKWEVLFSRYSALSTLDILGNINITRETIYGKSNTKSGSSRTAKTGTETETTRLNETRTESYDSQNPRKSSRAISGTYTDTSNETATRTGTEETTESFPSTRTSTKTTRGGYSDTDTITNTRTGSQKVTDKGDTLSSTYGFNSSNPVPSSVVGAADPSIGTTSETTYGEQGLKDVHSGSITRAYDPSTGLVETTAETGERKTATTFGQDGLVDQTSGGVTRSYDNYKDEVTETGSKSLNISYGQNGKTVENSFNNRSDSTTSSETSTDSGSDTATELGYKYDSLVNEYLALFMGAEYIDFLEIVFADCDEVLTCPFYV